jgi:hypothetical protein
MFVAEPLSYTAGMWRSAFSSISRHSSQRSEVGLLVRCSMTTRGYCLQFDIQCHLSGSAPFTYSSKHKPSTVIYYAPNICNLRKYKTVKFSTDKNEAVKCIKSSLDSKCFSLEYFQKEKNRLKSIVLLCLASFPRASITTILRFSIKRSILFLANRTFLIQPTLHLTYVS